MATVSAGEDEAWLNSKRSGEKSPSYKTEDENLWSRRSTLEKILIGLLVLALLLFVIIVIIFILHTQSTSSSNSSSGSEGSGAGSTGSFAMPYVVEHAGTEICLTKECIRAAADVDRQIDYSVNPCDDFYEFACGRWMKENVIPEDEADLSTFAILRDELEIVLNNLLKEEKKPDDLDSIKKAKDLYASCMDLDTINKRGDQAMKDLLVSEFGGWPLTHSGWTEDSFDLTDMMMKANRLSRRPIINMYVGLDSKKTDDRTLVIDQPGFGMPGQKYYQVPRDDEMLTAYEALIYGVAELQGFADPTQAKLEVKELVDFEILLANISVPDEERRDSNALYNPMTLAQVHGNYSEILDWRRYVTTLLSEVGVTDITDDEVIINQSPLYFSRLIDLLKKTPKRTLANYIMWRIAFGMVGTQGDNYNELILDYRKVLYGTSTESARFRICTSFTTGILGLAVGRMFVKENFQVEAKNMALEMIEDIREAFNELLENIDWMDEETKALAREKNNDISPKIGYPEQILNDTFLETRYANLTYERDTYFENVISNQRFYFYFSMSRLREKQDKDKWEIAPSTVNAYYSSVSNQIMFPAGILQPPFFSKSFPKSLNYGGIGVVIGHEITHGFDDRGRQYDKHGNLAQWWKQEAIDAFKEKAQCFIDQYGNFTVESIGQQLNGVNTQGENIADNGGLKQSFKAYRDWVQRRGREEPRLPGLDFTHNQLFFVSFAQLWCSLQRDGSLVKRVRTGVHSLPRYRVIGSAQNTPDFSEAFNCPVGSYMNPEKKCSVW